MKFFSDQCVPESMCSFLEMQGHEVIRLRKVMQTDSSDILVIKMATEVNAILLSLNGDFSNIVLFDPSQYKGIFAIQLKNNPADLPTILNVMQKILSGKIQKDFEGKLVSISSSKVRIR